MSSVDQTCLSAYDEFAGWGGTSQGWEAVDNVKVTDAANHDAESVAAHKLNFPNARHYQEDITALDLKKVPRVDLFSFSPACPSWTGANGLPREFDKVNSAPALFDGDEYRNLSDKDKERLKTYRRARLLMREGPRYLRAMRERDPRNPVLAGFMENVTECRKWAEWDDWIGEFRKEGYRTYVIAYNSMFAQPINTRWAAQSRNRCYVAYIHESVGRLPDFRKWLDPQAWCPRCDKQVHAMQVFKDPGRDMGDYGPKNGSWVYLCPTTGCNTILKPPAKAALTVIDPSVPGIRIGDRHLHGLPVLKPRTYDRIHNGAIKHWLPLLVPTGDIHLEAANRWIVKAARALARAGDGAELAPMFIPVEGRDGHPAFPSSEPMRTQTTRSETALAFPPFITPLRGGGDIGRARAITDPLSTVSANGNHHGLVTAPPDLLVPYYGSANSAYPATEPVGALTTHDRYGVAGYQDRGLDSVIDIEDVLFRMLEPHEIAAAMAFSRDYKTPATSRRVAVRGYGNAVTPPVAELIASALVEAITGNEMDRHSLELAAA